MAHDDAARLRLGPLVGAVVARPRLWPTAVRQVVRLARPGWWRRWPPLPVPDPAYLRFRLQTAYGEGAYEVEPADLVDYLEWCRREGSWGRGGRPRYPRAR